MNLLHEIDPSKFRIAVVGAGSWGTALANLLAVKGFNIDLWVFEKEVKDQILEFGENKLFLPNVKLSSNIRPSNELAEVVTDKELIVVVVPSHVMRATTVKMADLVSNETIIVSASKGIENKTHLTMTGVLQETLVNISQHFLAVISGPSFAKEVVKFILSDTTIEVV